METRSFSLGRWLPTLGKLRPMVPGELVLLIGSTGAGKTGILQSITNATRPLPTLFFELELPAEMMYERFISSKTNISARLVEESYTSGDLLGKEQLQRNFPGLFICTESKMTTERLENLITKSSLKIGEPPKVVLLDYIQLMDAKGSRYERFSNIAEQLKIIAKSTRTIIIVASQTQRPQGDEKRIGLHSGKESGSLENSASLVLGMDRDENDSKILYIRVLKSTKGGAGLEVVCNFDGEKMRITERSKIGDTEVYADK